MHMGNTPLKPEVPDALTVSGSAERANNLLWNGRPAWFKVFFAWWLLPIVIVVWWMFILGESVNRSTAEFQARHEARNKDLKERGLI